MKKALLIVAALLVVFGVIGALVGEDDDPEGDRVAGDPTEPTQVDEVTITSCATEPAFDWVVIKGEATNGSSKRSNYSIDLAVEGPDGVQLGTTFAFAQNVEPDQTALWESPTTVKGIDGMTCRVVKVERDASL